MQDAIGEAITRVRENCAPHRYIVWVGGLDDHFKTKEEAEQSAADWKAKGYTDVIIEKGMW